jgi:two-component system sensor histidine kinase UhpB
MPLPALPARLLRPLGLAFWPLLLALLLAGGPAWAAPVQLLTQARMLPLVPGQAADWNRATPVQLPDDWATSRPAQQGVVAYRLALAAPAADAAGSTLHGLSIERACSVLAVWLNGQMIHDGGRFDEPVSRQCHRPQLVAVPAALLQPDGNVLELRIRGYALAEVSSRQRAGGLSAVVFGAFDTVAAHHARQLLFAIRLPEVLSGALVLMGSFMFVMGWFNRAQSYLAYFGALMVGWSLLLARLWASDLPVSNGTAELVLASLMAFITLATVQFLMRYAGHRLRWLDLALPAQCLLMPATLLALGPQRLQMASSLWYAALSAQAVAAAVFYLVQARRQRSRLVWPMAALLGVVAVSLLVELIALGWRLDSRVVHVAQLLPALGFLALGLRLVQQYGRAFQTAEQNRAELEVRIREATAQIERNFAQLSELKVEQVTDRERKRIAADLHDDLGAKLLTIVHTSDDERISTLAREALEEMRLSVRGLTGKPVKLIDALGDWRAEVVMRLSQGGVGRMECAVGRRGAADACRTRLRADHPHPARGGQQHHQAQRRVALRPISLHQENGDFQLVIAGQRQGHPDGAGRPARPRPRHVQHEGPRQAVAGPMPGGVRPRLRNRDPPHVAARTCTRRLPAC